MHAVARQLDEVLDRLDPEAAGLLEQRVREAVAQAAPSPDSGEETDEMGYPIGYFESTFGSLAGERFDYPDDPPPPERTAW